MALGSSISRRIAAALLLGGFLLSGFGITMGTAFADDTFPPHQWCPGDPKNYPYSPGDSVGWDWSVCHTWYPTKYGMGNVNSVSGSPMSIWEGNDPPLDAITRTRCPLPPFPPSC